MVAPASAANHKPGGQCGKQGRWSRLGCKAGIVGKSPPAKTGTRVTQATNWMTCVLSQDAGPGLASQVSRDKPVGLRPARL